MEWDDFRKHLGLTPKEEDQISFVKDHLNELSPEMIKLLNDLKQYYKMKPESINLLKEKIFEEIERYKDEYEKQGYDIGYDDGYTEGINSRKRR